MDTLCGLVTAGPNATRRRRALAVIASRLADPDPAVRAHAAHAALPLVLAPADAVDAALLAYGAPPAQDGGDAGGGGSGGGGAVALLCSDDEDVRCATRAGAGYIAHLTPSGRSRPRPCRAPAPPTAYLPPPLPTLPSFY
jgi:hypothetical protein